MELTAETLLDAYANGYFPMAESKEATELHWFHPELRGILPLDDFHTPKSLQKFLRKAPYILTTDRAFREVITACAERDETWINARIIDLYCELHAMGFAHSVECWHENELIGGLYGVALGGAFFGESMFSRRENASKAALVHLVALLKKTGYTLLDTQYTNEHIRQFGVIEIPREEYMEQLARALTITPRAFV